MIETETAEAKITKHNHHLDGHHFDGMLFVSPKLKCDEVVKEIKKIYSTKPSIYNPKIAKEITIFFWDGKCKHKKNCADRECTICFEAVYPMHVEDIKKIPVEKRNTDTVLIYKRATNGSIKVVYNY